MATVVFDENLKNRLVAFQEANGLLADGVAGEKTWAKIVSGPEAKTSGEKADEEGAKAEAVAPQPGEVWLDESGEKRLVITDEKQAADLLKELLLGTSPLKATFTDDGVIELVN